MDEEQLRQLFEQVREGAVDVDSAMHRLRHMPFEDLGFAKVDHHRALRHGMPEVIFGKGKSPEQVIAIAACLLENSRNVLITRAEPRYRRTCSSAFRIRRILSAFRRHSLLARQDRARQGQNRGGLRRHQRHPGGRRSAVTAEVMGNEVDAIHDVGVAGIHRLMSHAARLTEARVVVVCAGMEGALPSAVGGMVSCPVIAVPTSIGYGASFHGLAALLGMLTSCASNVAVVNIDNGFGAGYVASLINRV